MRKGRMKVSYPFFVTLSQKKAYTRARIVVLSVNDEDRNQEGMWIWKRK